jgi:hypothetical protein
VKGGNYVLFRKNENQSLLKETRYSLKNAEKKIVELRQEAKEKDKMVEQSKTQYAIYQAALYEIKKINSMQQFNSVTNLQNKIKSVLDKVHI